MDTVVLALFVFFGLLGITFIILRIVQERQRREQLQATAFRAGLTYSAEAEPGLWERVTDFALFSKWGRRKIYNVLHRQVQDIDVTMFDYEYTTMRSKHHHTYYYTAALFETDRLRLPRFTLAPQYFYHQIADALGFRDIDFEGYPVFSDRYRLQGDDEASIRRLFDEEALLYFTRHLGLHTEGHGRQLLLYQDKRRVDPKEMEPFMQQGLDILDLFIERQGALTGLELLGLDIEDASDDPPASA